MTDNKIELPATVEEARSLEPIQLYESEYFGEVISVYTRAQTIEDGYLHDVSETAREAGFIVPVAITNGVAVLCTPPKSNKIESFEGRLWDVLWMAFNAIKGNIPTQRVRDDLLYYKLRIGRANRVMKLHSGPGDHGEHVITIMLPDED